MVEKDNAIEKFLLDIETELEQSQNTLSEVELMLDQSQSELTKLTQRNATVNAHLQQIQNQIDSIPRNDIKVAYNSALDAQQRMLVMRSQLEKLQGDQSNLKKRINLYERFRTIVSDNEMPEKTKTGSNGTGAAMLEMMINSQETERQRLSRQMHDGPAQALSNFIVQAEIASRLFDLDKEKAKSEMENLKASAMGTFQKVRSYITELRPMALDDLGLIPTMRSYVEGFKEQHGVEASFTVNGTERRLLPYVEIMIFRALQELMGNALRHNQDQAVKIQITVQFIFDDNFVKMIVSDTGKGFEISKISSFSGLGLKVIRERVEILSGFMDIDSAIGQGCRVTIQLPVASSIPTL
ncbi:MAG: ATP-binding protein [Anaerolineaceae bacterium]